MSNSNAVVDVQGISKSYELDALRYSSLRESVNKLLLNPFRKNQRAERKQQNTVWALQDVTFSLDAGDVLGIVGHNGSGKSTLLKILSRVIKPTTGSGTIKGQVISLLEVGTGFHPELTGHENIFFSGNLLNLPDEKIHENYDAILEFANIGRYISVPVKHYSSGMRVRLAFAIAALCKPDILITDEVLQVGDKDFRDKSLRVIQEMIEEESTVIISSHSTSLLSELCNRVLWLDHGQVIHYGDVDALTVYEEHRTFGNVGAASQDNTQRPDPEIVAEEIQALKEQRRAEQEQRQAEEAAAAAQAITEAMEAAEAEQEATDTAEEETPDLPTGRVEFHPPLGDEYARLVSLDIVNTHGESVSRVNYNEDAYIHVNTTSRSPSPSSPSRHKSSPAGKSTRSERTR